MRGESTVGHVVLEVAAVLASSRPSTGFVLCWGCGRLRCHSSRRCRQAAALQLGLWK